MPPRVSRHPASSDCAVTALVGESAYKELTRAAQEASVPLPQYVVDSVERRAAVELMAPSSRWFAIPAEVSAIPMSLSEEALTDIQELCRLTGQRQEVVISNLASGGPPTSALELPLGYLRTDPGRGRMFGMYFEIPGFQYALMRHLAGERLTVSRVMDLAFLALAKQAATTGSLNEHPISEAARQFATKVVMIEGRRRPPSSRSAT